MRILSLSKKFVVIKMERYPIVILQFLAHDKISSNEWNYKNVNNTLA